MIAEAVRHGESIWMTVGPMLTTVTLMFGLVGGAMWFERRPRRKLPRGVRRVR